MNRTSENQYLLYIVPLMKHTIVVCINSIIVMSIWCLFVKVTHVNCTPHT
jgi:hypothetical protein